MTNESAIKQLERMKMDKSHTGDEYNAIMVAIKALEQDNCPYYVIDEDGHGLCKNHRLEQEPIGDAISRQAVLDILEKEGHKWGNDYRDWVDAIEEIKKLPFVNPASNISIQITEREKYGRFN